MQRPLTGEYRPYFQRYIDLVPETDIRDTLIEQVDLVISYFTAIPADKHNYRYAEDKWTIKEVLMHLMDTERVMCYRAWVAARGDSQTVLYSMDENSYAANVDVSGRSMPDLLEEFEAIRTATTKLYSHMTNEQSKLPARMQDGTIVTPRALGYIMAGHTLHHFRVINERYL